MALGGLLVGGLSVLEPRVWGNGYSVVTSILHEPWLVDALLLILLLKVSATAAAVGSGAVGGVFTPTLFVGAVLGALFGLGMEHLFPAHSASVAAYVMVGMGAFLAATTHAPIMAMLMLFEMTLDYAIVPPLMLACVVAYYVSQRLSADSIYSDSLRRKTAAPEVH
jgi:CIC family chloride channel protein